MDCKTTLDPLPAVPQSVQAILTQLHGHSPMTGKQLREATGLPRRTVYTALRRLREMGLLSERQSLRDTRQTYFWISTEAHDKLHGESTNWTHPAALSH